MDASSLQLAPAAALGTTAILSSTDLNSSLDCHLGVKSLNWSICIQNERRIRESIDSLPSHLKDEDELKMKFTSKHPFREAYKGSFGKLFGDSYRDPFKDSFKGPFKDPFKDPFKNPFRDPTRNKRKIRRRAKAHEASLASTSLPTSFRPITIGKPNYNSSNNLSDLTRVDNERKSNKLPDSRQINRQSNRQSSRQSSRRLNEQPNEDLNKDLNIELNRELDRELNRDLNRDPNRSVEHGEEASGQSSDGRHKNANKAKGPLSEPQFNRFKSSPADSGGPISSISKALFSSPLSSFFLSSSATPAAASSRSPEPIEVPLVEPLKNNFTLDSKRSNNEQTSDLLSSSLAPPPTNATLAFSPITSLVQRTDWSSVERSTQSIERSGERSSERSSRLDDRLVDAFTRLPSTANDAISQSGGKFVNKKFKKGDHPNERTVTIDDDRSETNRTAGQPTSTTASTSNATDWWLNATSSVEPSTYIPEITVKSALLLIGAVFLSLITMLGNMLVMISLIIDRQLRTISNYYLLSLSIADFMIGLISMPLYTLYVLLDRWPLSPLVCDCWLALDYLNSNASVLNLLCISVDRYLSITRPLTYRAKRTAKKAWCWIATTWIISSLLWPPWVFFFPYYEGE